MNGLPGNPSTNTNGYYSAEVDDGWSGTVTPQKSGYTFDAANRIYTNVTSDQTNQNYTGTLPVGVTISAFDALDQGAAILATWETATEAGTLGFNLYRSLKRKGPGDKINAEPIESQLPLGSPSGALYSYQDSDVELKTNYYYWLEAVDLDGGTELELVGPVRGRVQSVEDSEAPYRLLIPVSRNRHE
jgi:hypothetical protein